MSKKLEQLQRKQAALQKQIMAEKARVSAKERKNDTRRKILLGAFFQAKLEESEAYKMQVMQELERYLIKDNDRALFGFDPLPKPKPANEENTQPQNPENQPAEQQQTPLRMPSFFQGN